jgi:hypothetical protein
MAFVESADRWAHEVLVRQHSFQTRSRCRETVADVVRHLKAQDSAIDLIDVGIRTKSATLNGRRAQAPVHAKKMRT